MNRQFAIQRVLAVLALRTYKVTAVHANATLDEGSYDVRRQALAIAYNGSLRLLA